MTKEGVTKIIIGIHTGHDDNILMNYGIVIAPSLRKWPIREDGLIKTKDCILHFSS